MQENSTSIISYKFLLCEKGSTFSKVLEKRKLGLIQFFVKTGIYQKAKFDSQEKGPIDSLLAVVI